jgi:hypothetical protein
MMKTNNKKKGNTAKKLIPAAMMLAVSASMLGTSTYAWFTMNTTVTVTGMSVNAQADNSLVVKGLTNSTDTDYTSVGTNVVTEATLKPCTSKDGVNFGRLGADVKVESAAASPATWSGTAGAFAATDLVSIDLASQDTGLTSGTKFVAKSEYSVKSIHSAQTVYVKDVDVSVTGGGTNPMLNSARVAVARSGQTTLVFNPNGGTLNGGKVGAYASSTWSLDDPSYTTENTTTATLGSFSADTADTITVYIWFEGQDTTCFTDNIDADNLVVTLKLTTETPT